MSISKKTELEATQEVKKKSGKKGGAKRDKKRRRQYALIFPARPSGPCDCPPGEPHKKECLFTREMVEEALEGLGYVGQLERGEEDGYLHWHIMISHASDDTALEWSWIYERVRAVSDHGFELEPARNPWGLQKYTLKDETRVESEPRLYTPRYKWIEKPKGRKGLAYCAPLLDEGMSADDLLVEYKLSASTHNSLKNIENVKRSRTAKALEDEPVKIFYIYGETGTGKSSYVRGSVPRSDLFVAGSGKHPWDTYAGEPVMLIDEFNDRNFDLDFMKQLLDRYCVLLPCRYNDKRCLAITVYLVSNKPLEDLYRWARPEDFDPLLRRIDEGGGGYFECVAEPELSTLIPRELPWRKPK